jgi:hyperosmotically inducible protein
MRNNKIALSGAMLCLTLTGIALTQTGCAGDRYQRSTGAYLDDKGISTRVKTALFRDPNVSGFDVHVNTFRGDVQLSGFVDTPEQREHAAALAREVSGVRMVTNNLEVKPSSAVGTPGNPIEGSTRTLTNQNPDIPAADNVVRTPAPLDNRPLDNRPLDNRALDNRPLDNRPLDNNLDRNTSRFAPDQNRSFDQNTTVVPTPNTATEPLPGRPNIDISSANGRATLRGTVGSEDEKRAVARKLLSVPGIVTVDNQLEVRPTAQPLTR